jgi:hypothetical protein
MRVENLEAQTGACVKSFYHTAARKQPINEGGSTNFGSDMRGNCAATVANGMFPRNLMSVAVYSAPRKQVQNANFTMRRVR